MIRIEVGDFILYEYDENKYIGEIIDIKKHILLVNPEISLDKEEFYTDTIEVKRSRVLKKLEGVKSVYNQVKEKFPYYTI